MSCDTYNCKRLAVFRTTRLDKPEAKHWCSPCFAQKVAKYELRAERTK